MTVADGQVTLVYGAQARRVIEDALAVEAANAKAEDGQVREAARRVLQRYPEAVVQAVKHGH